MGDSTSLFASNEDPDLMTSQEDGECLTLNYVADVVKPISHGNQEQAIIIHCVDNSGQWGEGGVFSALNKLSADVSLRYKLASDMKDLTFGDVHVVPIKEDDKQSGDKVGRYVALIVAQKRSNKGVIGDIDVTVLDSAFEVIAQFCKKQRAAGYTSVIHSPHLGHSMKTFNWYCAERLLKKHFISKNVKTLVYYHSRRNHTYSTQIQSRKLVADYGIADDEPSTSSIEINNVSNNSEKNGVTLPSFLSGCCFLSYRLTFQKTSHVLLKGTSLHMMVT